MNILNLLQNLDPNTMIDVRHGINESAVDSFTVGDLLKAVHQTPTAGYYNRAQKLVCGTCEATNAPIAKFCRECGRRFEWSPSTIETTVAIAMDNLKQSPRQARVTGLTTDGISYGGTD